MADAALLMQISDREGRHIAALLEGDTVYPSAEGLTMLDLAERAVATGTPLAELAREAPKAGPESCEALTAEGRIAAPVTHPEPARLHLTGTGLTHLGSADTRDAMHSAEAAETDSRRMFRWGIEGGRPEGAAPGVQPEWFYKGDGGWLVAPGGDLASPRFALDGGEEPEIAGIYLVGPDGRAHRLGFALANEFSDHVMEKQNYLYLAHSKLRPCSIGPAIRTGALPESVTGVSRHLRGGAEVWSREFLTGEANMSHSLANLEHHHFKYDRFRRPGDLHVHMFGTATLSYADGVLARDGDVFEIAAPGFGPALSNRLRVEAGGGETRLAVNTL